MKYCERVASEINDSPSLDMSPVHPRSADADDMINNRISAINRCLFNSLWPSDAIWRQKTGSTLARVMVCCLAEPSHYLNQCWLITSKVQWHSCEGNVARDTSTSNYLNQVEKYLIEISFKSPRGQWVKAERNLCHSPSNKQYKLKCFWSPELALSRDKKKFWWNIW